MLQPPSSSRPHEVNTSDNRPQQNRTSVAGCVAAAVVGVFGFLPIVNWVPGGRQVGWYSPVASQWMTGTLIAVGIGAVSAILGRRWQPSVTPWRSLARLASLHPARTGVLLGSIACLLYSLVALKVFSGVPLHLDEISQVVQARIFATGRLYLESGNTPEFRSLLHVLDGEGKWYAQFPPGGPLMLVPGVLLGVSWLSGPVMGALSVALFWGVVRRLVSSPQVALGAAILFALTPFVVFMSGSHMNHVAALLWVLVAAYAVARLSEKEDRQVLWALLLGFALGMLAATRPVDAVAFALPAGVWMLWRARVGANRVAELLVSGVGVALPVGALLLYNQETTGSAFLFAYEKLWGSEHGLGFHQPPWGEAHTPARGLELISLYFLRLQTYLFETPVPSLLFVAAALLVVRLRSAVERMWLASAALLLVLYFLYWHDGFYLGPRFVYLLTPFCVLLVARGLGEMGEVIASSDVRRGVWGTVAASAVMAAGLNVPERTGQYRAGLSIMRQDPVAVAQAAGVTNSLVLVRESWGAQLVARLWALGVSRGATEGLYRTVDACALDESISALERDGTRGLAAEGVLRGLAADSARLVSSPWSPDGSERALPGRAYGATCQSRITEDRIGFTIFAPLLVRDWGTNVFARDLHARDSVLFASHPQRPVFLLRSASAEPGAPLVLIPVSRDSAQASWAK